MDGLIIAAGRGTRLRDLSPCKPLTPVCGRMLIELAIAGLASAGISRIVVVTGYEAEKIERELPRIAVNEGVEIVAARTADWMKPNGHSVVAGAGLIEDEYLLVMADHLLSPVILEKLAALPRAHSGATLAVDRRLDNPCIDPADATYVTTGPDGRITRIAKGLALPDAVDCGAFRCTPELAAAITHAIASGRAGSLSEGMQELADRGRATTMDIGDTWWIDVDDPASHAMAEAQLGLFLTSGLALPVNSFSPTPGIAQARMA